MTKCNGSVVSWSIDLGIREDNDPFHLDVENLIAADSKCGFREFLSSAEAIVSILCRRMWRAVVPLREFGSLRRIRFLADWDSTMSFLGIRSATRPL